jgi:hypothetical protein
MTYEMIKMSTTNPLLNFLANAYNKITLYTKLAFACFKIKRLGMDDVKVTVEKNVASIQYFARKRCYLQYDELQQLKRIINPAAEDDPIPMGWYGKYTIYIRFST